MRIIAVDPGEETGYATGYVSGKTLFIVSHGWRPWVQFCYQLNKEQGSDEPYDIIVYETWNLRKPKELYGSDMPSSQAIGQIKAAAHWNDKKAMLVKSAPANKPVADALMRKLDVHLPTSEVDHNRDAIRHLVHYAITRLGVEAVEYIDE